MHNSQIIKFVDGARNAEITAVDRGILELKSAVQNLHAQVEDIQRKVDGWVAFRCGSLCYLTDHKFIQMYDEGICRIGAETKTHRIELPSVEETTRRVAHKATRLPGNTAINVDTS